MPESPRKSDDTESREDLQMKVNSQRPKIVPTKLLEETETETETEETNKKKIDQKESQHTTLKSSTLDNKLLSVLNSHANRQRNEVAALQKRKFEGTDEPNKIARNESPPKKRPTNIDNENIDVQSFPNIFKELEDMKKKVYKLSKEKDALKDDLKKCQTENKTLIDLNFRQQREILEKFSEWTTTFDNLRKGGSNEIGDPLMSGNELPVGLVRSNENKVHLGAGVWLRKDTFDDLAKMSKSPSIFVKNLAVSVFTPDVLRNSSVTGKISAKKKQAGENARPRLDPDGINAIKMTLRVWMEKKKYEAASVDVHCNSVGTYISHKIDDMNRKYNKHSNETKETFMSKNGDRNEREESEDGHDKDKIIEDSRNIDGNAENVPDESEEVSEVINTGDPSAKKDNIINDASSSSDDHSMMENEDDVNISN